MFTVFSTKQMVAWSLVSLFALGGCQSLSPKQEGAAKKNPFTRSGPGQKKLVPDSNELLDPLGARNPNRVLAQDLSPGQIGTTLKTMGRRKTNEAAARTAFDEGRRLYDRAIQLRESSPEDPEAVELFEKAASQFRIAAHHWPDSSMQQDALFFQGESFYFSNRYVQANRAFESLIVQYAGSPYFDRAEERRFSIARYWLGRAREETGLKSFRPGDPTRPASGMAGEARRILHRIRLDDPTGKLADDATMQLAAAFMEVKQFQDAADAFEDLRRSYPGSQHLFNAHLFELKCRLNCYYGRSYEAEPLVKADKLLREIMQRFPGESGKHHDYLAKEAAQVRHLLAEREFTMGTYYENRGENRAARMMYENVGEKFADTAWASEVGRRIEATGEGPPLPPQQAQWLVDLFPATDTARPLIASGDKEGILKR